MDKQNVVFVHTGIMQGEDCLYLPSRSAVDMKLNVLWVLRTVHALPCYLLSLLELITDRLRGRGRQKDNKEIIEDWIL